MIKLPDAEILKTLNKTDPNAGAWIMNRVEDIQQERFEKANKELVTQATKIRYQAFLKGMSSIFNLFSPAPEKTPRLTLTQANVSSDWNTVSTYLIQAINDYMAEHNIDPKHILTPTQQKQLDVNGIDTPAP